MLSAVSRRRIRPPTRTIQRSAPQSRAADADDPDSLRSSLELGRRLLAAASAFAVEFALEDLDGLDLPPAADSAADQAILRSLAPMYLASELESARLLPAVEILAGLFVSGGLPGDPGPAAAGLTEFWRQRRERLAATERQAFFARFFGSRGGPTLAAGAGAANLEFEDRMITLTEALYRLDGATPGIAADVRVQTAARSLTENLLARGHGLAQFVAEDLLNTLGEATELLKQPALLRVVGAASPWLAVRRLTTRYLGEDPNISAHVTRGKAGLLVLAWLAESSGRLDRFDEPLARPADPVVAAATAWLTASLELSEPTGHP